MGTLFGFLAGENDGLHINKMYVFGIKQLKGNSDRVKSQSHGMPLGKEEKQHAVSLSQLPPCKDTQPWVEIFSKPS